MKLYDPAFLPEESDDLLDFLDLDDETEESAPQPIKESLADFAYEHGLGELQLRDLIRQSSDGRSVTLNGKTFTL